MPTCQWLPSLRRNEVSTTVFRCFCDHHRENIYWTTNPKLTCGNRSRSVLFALHVLLCILFRRSFTVHISVPVHVVKVCRWSKAMAPFILNLCTIRKWMVNIVNSKYTNSEIYSHDSSLLLGKHAWFRVTQFNNRWHRRFLLLVTVVSCRILSPKAAIKGRQVSQQVTTTTFSGSELHVCLGINLHVKLRNSNIKL